MAHVYDSMDIAALPGDGDAYLGYIDGKFTAGHYAQMRQRFPTKRLLSVTTTGTNPANICDVEGGDATIATAVAGVKAGLYHTVYSFLSNYAPLRDAMGALPWNFYAADPTGRDHVVPGSVGTQWAWPGKGSPGDYDISTVLDSWLNPPPPPPQPPAQGAALMICEDPQTGGNWCVSPVDGHIETFGGAPYLGGLNSPPDRFSWQQVGQIVGIAPSGVAPNIGYSIAVLATIGPVYFHLYTFPRNGSLADTEG